MSESVISVASLIHVIRGQRVMMDFDLSRLYGISTKSLRQAVKRNAERFPDDFSFLLDRKEVAILRSQFVTSRRGRIALFAHGLYRAGGGDVVVGLAQ
ncbi:MAG TPA: ORF6N domain-containing protein [Kiritimatiellia bacterium]|nr:ORF6N domain-containing protein [Kiritimatiellia bacterium]